MRTEQTHRRERRGNHFWQSFADMMAAVLLVFLLVLAGVILQLLEDYEILSDEALRAQTEANEAMTELEQLRQDAMQAQKEAEDAIAELEQQGQELERILGIRQSIIETLRTQFQEDELRVDPQTGAVVFKGDLMFDFKETTLQSAYRDKLRVYIKRYVDILLSAEFAPYVAEIIIEGHTDSTGSYEDNLWFSQQRALSVATFILSSEERIFSGEQLTYLRQITTINGRSESELITVNGQEDPVASRRVEIQFRLKDEEMIRNMIAVIQTSDTKKE